MVVDGVKLLRMIRDNKFKNGDRIKEIEIGRIYEYDGEYGFWQIRTDDYIRINELEVSMIVNRKFEILSEEDKEIDIQAIEELDLWAGYNASDDKNIIDNRQKINEVIKAIKQLDKKIKE